MKIFQTDIPCQWIGNHIRSLTVFLHSENRARLIRSGSVTYKLENMRKITLSEYNAIPENYRGIWTIERWDLPDWAEIRKRHIGKRTMMVYDKGTCLLVEGIGFEIVDDSDWKKPDEIRKDIDMLYQEFCNMRKCEPHYADCIIRWQDTLDTLETRIALSMDSDTEWDEEIFYYCNSRNELKSLTEKGCSDFVIADCFGFGMYEKPMQEI